MVPDVLGAPPERPALRHQRAVQPQAEGPKAVAGVGLVREEPVVDACVCVCLRFWMGGLGRWSGIFIDRKGEVERVEMCLCWIDGCIHQPTKAKAKQGVAPRTPAHDEAEVGVDVAERQLLPGQRVARVELVDQACVRVGGRSEKGER